MIEYNALDVLNQRQLDYMPVHFKKFSLDHSRYSIDKESILNWVRQKLNGRFSITKSSVIKDNRLVSSIVIGFEKHSELTYFIIACPFIRRNT